jgi:glycosyltransferase involved in cell wall biosynthesis
VGNATRSSARPAGAVNPDAIVRGRPLRVLHGVYEIAGQGMMLAQALCEQGCVAHALSYHVDWDARRSDIVVEIDPAAGPISNGLAMAGTFARLAPRYDIFHFHFGTTFLPRRLDVPWIRRMGRAVVFHFHGCEVRNRDHMLRHARLSTCTDCDPFCRPRHQQRLLEDARRWGDRLLYSTLDLGASIPGGEPLPLAIEAARWTAAAARHPLPSPESRDGVRGPVVIGHAPTNRLIKGTRHVVAAVERLRGEFPKLELRMIERRPWAEMPEFLAGCDILVDQLHMGWYGLLAIEGMAEGKPVIAYLRDDFLADHPGVPVVNAEPATLEAALRELIRNPERRAELGAAGRTFARSAHDTTVVGAKLLAIYREILTRRGRGAVHPENPAEVAR